MKTLLKSNSFISKTFLFTKIAVVFCQLQLH